MPHNVGSLILQPEIVIFVGAGWLVVGSGGRRKAVAGEVAQSLG
jgi:hypothetical protein